MSIPLIILAAGRSARLEQPKQFLLFKGRTLIENCARAALASVCSPVLVVAGSEKDRIADVLNGLDVHIIENDRWHEGIASSIRSGISSALQLDPDAQAFVLSVCDQPLITAETFDGLVRAYEHSQVQIVASAYAQTLGVPALFDRALLSELIALTGDAGAKRIILEHSSTAISVAFPQGAIDIDSPGDLDAIPLL